MSLYGSRNIGYQIVDSRKKKRSLLFDRVQNDTKISDFRKYIHKNLNIYHTDHHKRTILMFTAQNYHLEVFIYLVHNYPKLILKTDDIEMNIMHYIASSNTDDESMVELITNKKFCYNKLVWMRNKHGLLPKDMAKQSNNKHIIKTLESIMHDTWAEYSYIARNNNIEELKHRHITHDRHDSDSEDMDIDHDVCTHTKQPPQQEIRSNSSCNVPHKIIAISAKKRKHQTVCDFVLNNGDNESYYPSLQTANICKRRKLNGLGSYIRTTPQQPTVSPSPLPPLPPIQLAPFTLNPDSSPIVSSISDSSSSSTPSTFLSLSLPCHAPQLMRSRAIVDTTMLEKRLCVQNQDMDKIANAYYNGGNISKEQFMFCRWFLERFGSGGDDVLRMVIQKGYDDMHKFMRENWIQSEIKTLNRNQVFGEYNNNVCIGGIATNVEMDRFNDRMRELQLTPDRMDQEDQDNQEDDIGSALISDSVINSSDSISGWRYSQCEISEDDDL